MLRIFDPNKTITKVSILEEKFNYQNSAHLEYINQAIDRFTLTQKALQANDQSIINAAAICIGCWIGSYLFPTVTASLIASCFATYHWTKRPEYQKQYKNALTDLISVYEWSMGATTNHHWYKLAVKEIQHLILTLGPWVSRNTLETWGDDVLKPNTLDGYTVGRRKDISPEFEDKLHELQTGSHMARWQYRLYGENGIEDLETFFKSYVSKTVINSVVSFASSANPIHSKKM